MADNDYGPKTGAAEDHPYKDGETAPADTPAGRKSKVTPPDGHTKVDSEADIGDPSEPLSRISR